MENETGIVVKISESFNIQLERKLIDLKESGVKKTKAQYIVELAMAEFLHRTIQKEIK
jgi:hypothetical protein